MGYSEPTASVDHRRLAVRFRWAVCLSSVMAVVLCVRLVQIQWLQNGSYVDLGERQGVMSKSVTSFRGAILDRDFQLLSVSGVRPSIWADPRMVEDPYSAAAALSGTGLGDVLGEKEIEVLLRGVNGREQKQFAYLARHVPDEVKAEVEELGIKGVYVMEEEARLRSPDPALGRGIIGVTDTDGAALSGSELFFDGMLAGVDGEMTAKISLGGISLPGESELVESVRHGHDVVMSIDSGLQWTVEDILSSAVIMSGAKGGGAVVMDVKTGEVLASGGILTDESGEAYRPGHSVNFVYAFEPGSVLKTMTIAGALEEGLTYLDETHQVVRRYEHGGRVFVEPYPIGSDEITTKMILAKSSNNGTIRIAERLGAEGLYRYLVKFGFGSFSTGDLLGPFPGESHGILRASHEWGGEDLAALSFGQGIAVTNMQLVAAYNAIANGGQHVPVRLAVSYVSSLGDVFEMPYGPSLRVMSEETAEKVTEALSAVVEEGTGKLAGVEGAQVAGKTGTAQKPSDDGGYSEDEYMSVFVGFFPAEDPSVTISVFLDSPDDPRGGVSAAPVFSEIAEAVMRSDVP